MRRRGSGLVSAALALAFLALAVQVVVAGGVPGEEQVLDRVAPDAGAALAAPARLVDRATRNVPLAVVTAGLVVALVARGARRTGVLVALSVGGVLLGNPLLKRLVDRPRPELLAPLEGVSPLSFPSGHAAATAALATAVVLATPAARRTSAAVAAVLLVVVTAASQLVLARHHPSDLVGGWLWATSFTAAVWACGRGDLRSGP